MASTELYSSIAKPKKKYTFGQKLGDLGRLYADTQLSMLGASDVISDDAYKGEWAEKASGILSPIAGVAGQVALAAATGGTGNAALSAAKAVGPEIFAKGGLRTFEGNTHEQGGIKLGADEVEDSETMMPMDAQSDFIFSDRLYPIKSISPKGKIKFGKKTFAQLSKQINKPLELRPNDPYAKRTVDIKLGKLAQEQEALKQANDTEQFAMGGKRYFGGGPYPLLEDEAYVDDIPFDTASIVNSLKPDYNFMQDIQGSIGNGPVQFYSQSPAKPIINNTAINRRTITGVTPSLLTPKGYTPIQASPMKPGNPPSKEDIPYQSNFTLPALGYAAQALTNIPALFTKPETINSSRVKFDRINLVEQRNEARRARNLGLATARGIGATDAGQMMNYLSGTTAALNSLYGNQFNQSLLQEQQANAGMNMREQLANSEIERYDEQINAQERDAARALRMNALQNIGTIAAGAGRDYMAMQENDAMMNVLMGSNPDYTFDVNAPTGRMKWLKSKTLTPKRRKK